MSFETTQNSRLYTLQTGSGEQLPFPIPIIDSGNISALRNGTEMSPGLDFSVTVTEGSIGAVVNMMVGSPGDEILIRRVVPVTQEERYQEEGTFPSETTERALDKLTMIDQQQDEDLSRSIKVPIGDASPEFPVSSERAGKYWRFDDTTGETRLFDRDQVSADIGNALPPSQSDRPTDLFVDPQGRSQVEPAFKGKVGVDLDAIDDNSPMRSITVSNGQNIGNQTQTLKEEADSLYLPPVENAEVSLSEQLSSLSDVPREPLVEYSGKGGLASIKGLVEAVNVVENEDGSLQFRGDSYLVFEDDLFPVCFSQGLIFNADLDVVITNSAQGLVGCSSSTDTTRAEIIIGGRVNDANDDRANSDRELSYYVRGTTNLISDHGWRWPSAINTGRQTLNLTVRSNFDPAETGSPLSSLQVDGNTVPGQVLLSGSVYGIRRIPDRRFYIGMASDGGVPTSGTGFVGRIYSFRIDNSIDLRASRTTSLIAGREGTTFPAYGLPTIDCNNDDNVIIAMQRKNTSLGDSGRITAVLTTASNPGGAFGDLVILADDPLYGYQNFATWWSVDRWKILMSRWGSGEDEGTYRENTHTVPLEFHLAEVSKSGEILVPPQRIPSLDQVNHPGQFIIPSPSRAIKLKNGPNAGRVVAACWGYASSSISSDQVVLVYSDDDGATWDFSTPTGGSSRVNESSICELSDGTIFVSSRGSTSGERRIMLSADGGETLTPPDRRWGIRGPVVHQGICRIGTKIYMSSPPFPEVNNSGGNGRDAISVRELNISSTSGISSVVEPGQIFILPGLRDNLCAYSNLAETSDGNICFVSEHDNGNKGFFFDFRQSVSFAVLSNSKPPVSQATFNSTPAPIPSGAFIGDLANGTNDPGNLVRTWVQAGAIQENSGTLENSLNVPIDLIMSGGNETTAATFLGSGIISGGSGDFGLIYRGTWSSTNAQVPNQFDYAIIVVAELSKRLSIHVQNGNGSSSTPGLSLFTTGDGRLIARGAVGSERFAKHLPSFTNGLSVIRLEIDTSAGTISGALNGSTSGWLDGAGDSSVTTDSYTPNSNIIRTGGFVITDILEMVALKAQSTSQRDFVESELMTRHGITP